MMTYNVPHRRHFLRLRLFLIKVASLIFGIWRSELMGGEIEQNICENINNLKNIVSL
jgi:hypothetical protein